MVTHVPSQVKAGPRAPYTQGNPKPAPQPSKPSPIGFQFVALPQQLLRAGDLSFGAVVLFGVIADAARQSRIGSCRLANATLGERIGRSESEVGRYLEELEGAGLIRREYAGSAKFVRLGIKVTWVPEVQGTGSPEQVPEHHEGGSRSSGDRVPGVQGPIQSATQSEANRPAGAPLPGEESPPDGKALADYLRRCVAAARRGEPMPEPPAATNGCNPARPPVPQPQPSQDATRRTIEGFARSLGEPLALDELRPAIRRR